MSETTTTYPIFYFFYGTLTNPATLKRILDHETEPHLRPAQVTGYAVAKWGDYPALIESEAGQPVPGSAYLVRSEAEAQKLAHYETKAYMPVPCMIGFTDGGEPGEVSGMTFVYAGDAAALLEGRFDRKLWAREMGGKLG